MVSFALHHAKDLFANWNLVLLGTDDFPEAMQDQMQQYCWTLLMQWIRKKGTESDLLALEESPRIVESGRGHLGNGVTWYPTLGCGIAIIALYKHLQTFMIQN